MTSDLILPLIMRWAHILSAVVAVGGAVFSLLVLRPAAFAVLPEDLHASLRTAITGRWQRLVHAAIMLFLISGFYNYLAITRFQHIHQPLYHALFGLKFLLAIVVFGLGIALTSLKPWSVRMRQARAPLAWLVILAVVVVMLSSVLRTMPKATPELPAPVPVQTAV